MAADYQPLYRWDTLNEFLSAPISSFERITKEEYSRQDQAQKDTYDDARILHMNRGFVINTPDLDAILRTAQDIMIGNFGLNSGHGGLLLSGSGTMGKTTAAKAIMRRVHRKETLRNPNWRDDAKVPVAMVLVPTSGAKALAQRFAEFYGLTTRRTETLNEITSRVCAQVVEAGTKLVVVDEVQNMRPTDNLGRESLAFLKDLHDMVPATFVYCSAEINHGQVLTGDFASQLRGRFDTYRLARYSYDSEHDRSVWASLILGVEQELPLFEHQPGTLVARAADLHHHTQGSIADLVKVMKTAAIRRIIGGQTERLTWSDIAAVQPSMATVDLRDQAGNPGNGLAGDQVSGGATCSTPGNR